MPREEIQEDSFSSDEDLNDNSDSESSTDVDAKLAEDEVFDIEFLKCYSALKKKDTKIYDKTLRFFEHQQSSDEDDGGAIDKDNEKVEFNALKRKSTPKMTLLDHQMKLKDDVIDDQDVLQNPKIDLNKPVSKSFYEKELEQIKKSIEKVSENVDSDSDGDLLVVKGSEAQNSNSDSSNKIGSMLNMLEGEEDHDLEHLRQIWVDSEKLSEEDKFLRDYILNKMYLPSKEANDESKKSNEFFSENIDQLSDVDADDDPSTCNKNENQNEHHSDEKDFDKIARIPRNSTRTIRDLLEKQGKKEKRLKKIEKLKKKKKAIKNEDFEDIVAGMPTRFHYRETEPNDFGLSAEELLMATDEELDQWCKLENALKHRTPEEELDLKRKFDKKREDLDLKRKIFKSIYGDPAEDEVKAATANESDAGNQQQAIPNKRKKKHKRGTNHKKFAKAGVAPDRLLAYGLSKTKLKKSKLL